MIILHYILISCTNIVSKILYMYDMVIIRTSIIWYLSWKVCFENSVQNIETRKEQYVYNTGTIPLFLKTSWRISIARVQANLERLKINLCTVRSLLIFATTCHVMNYKWWKKVVGPCESTLFLLTSRQITICHKSCINSCGLSIFLDIMITKFIKEFQKNFEYILFYSIIQN